MSVRNPGDALFTYSSDDSHADTAVAIGSLGIDSAGAADGQRACTGIALWRGVQPAAGPSSPLCDLLSGDRQDVWHHQQMPAESGGTLRDGDSSAGRCLR